MLTILLVINVALGLSVGIIQLRYYLWLKHQGLNGWRWVKLALSMVGFMWASLYLLLVLDVFEKKSLAIVMQVAFLPAITITLGVLLMGAIISSKRAK